MKRFEFFFEGWPVAGASGQMESGIKVLSGDPVTVGRCLGIYANAALKMKNEPNAAMIVINAYHEFKKLNPDLLAKVENEIIARNGGIIKPL